MRQTSARQPASQWRIHKALAATITAAVLGTLNAATLRRRAQALVRHICDPPRKRQAQMRALAWAIGP